MQCEVRDERTDQKWKPFYYGVLEAKFKKTIMRGVHGMTVILSDIDPVRETQQGMPLLYAGTISRNPTIYLYCKRLEDSCMTDTKLFDLVTDCMDKAINDLTKHFYA